MIDWAGEIENRNYGIKRSTGPRKLCELMWIIFSLAMVAGALLFCAWIRNQIIGVGYGSQQLQAQEESLLREEKKLILEEQTLKNPERIEAIARAELGMAPLRANQLLTPQFLDAGPIGQDALALAAASHPAEEARKGPVTD